ncbi:MBG domain-containing protein [Limosilactobacillus reuteri]|uniref:MBG domain-containing protein n=1 Tax=Limosilactobacillus reuteri TaxID=1598 RepID=UPI00081BEC65|nr:MBG domain-containing protein [Limosilactobacillus reuteri]MCH5379727.1 BspA family leucine-rich repeat surface protein [Limosilactobacillus reuteri]OCW61818.1 YSIRK signal domain/LPXTG anchor domain surface protein [Limosilactobacillus reuteri]OCW62123.1 YSIRK signal domain/LPXTG anchor domain surface protein [Limosilactobacillus reuteri]OCW64870.1 YSIRK signal domain/LPXTG anchor domain surface protein [Limosilactobacillus reuteri]OCW68987.1 YSIRK signal domain/LPXTG anchor domain surface
MGKNNPLRSMTPKNKNYKLYKAKKQWITACATFMLTFGATAVVNASVQADTTTPATTQASGSTATVAALVQPQSAAAETAQNTDETKRNVVADTTDTSRTSEQKTTTAQDTETLSAASVANKTNSEEENKNAFLTFNVNTADTPANEALQENKIAATTATTTTNGGYDSATWGTLDTSKWTGRNTTFNGTDYYQLTGYTGDQTHIIVPNEADFAATGTSTNGLQVAISNNLLNQWKNATTIAFSKTDDKKVKLASNNLNNTFYNNTTLTNLDANSLDTSSVTSMQNTFNNATKLFSLTGIKDWDVSNVTNMTSTFQSMNNLQTLSGLEKWNVQKVTNMSNIFNEQNSNTVLDISALGNWKTTSLTNLSTAFANNHFTNLSGLENWDVNHVTNMSKTFMGNNNLIDLSALANWDTSNVTNLSMIFNLDSSLATLNGLEHWNTSKVTNLNATFANEGSLVDASAIANWNTSNVTNMSALFQGSKTEYLDLSKWDFSNVTTASSVINNIKTVVYLGNNSTITANNLTTLGFGQVTQPIILASGALYTLLSGRNSNTHAITIKNANGSPNTTIFVPVVYDAAGASNMTDAINSYKDMVDQKLEDYVTEHNYVLKRVSTAPVDDVTGHNNHLVNYANATYQVVTIPADQKKDIAVQNKTIYKGTILTAKDLVANSADFPAGTTFEFIDNSEPNWNQVGTYNVKVIATYPVSVNGQQYTAVTTPATAKVTVTQQMQFTITYWDDTENKEIVQFDIANAGNGAYDNQLSFPKGVNTNNYQSVSVSGVPAGADFAGDFWKPFTDQSCNWTIPNYKWDSAAAPSLFNANIVVHLVHKTQDVTNTDPGAQETRTVTADFVKINENGTPEAAPFDSATLDVYYIRKATKDLVTGKVTYGNWKLNTNKGSNGFQIVSGAWTLPTDSSSKITVTAPDLDGYEKADTQINGQLTTDFGTADSITSKLTTYYVPTSLTQKTINRVINMIGIDKSINGSALVKPSTTTQSATITRPVKVNADDSGVTFDGFDGSGWTTGKWGRYNNIPVPNNYTKVIKQIVTHPDGTTTETTLDIPNWRPIPAQTVTIATLPTVINITYTATATAFLAGTNESTYTGSPITLDDLNDGNGDNPIYVGVTGPTGGLYYTLQAGDVEFSSDNGQTWTTEMPTNAGTYELRWSEQGKQNIIKEFGNNSIKWVDAQGNSTFTSTATYIINPAPVTFTLSNQTSGNYTKIYDAQPTTSIDPSKLTITANFNNAKVVLDTTGLTSDSYEWVDAQGNSISNPENVGTYYIKLKDAALSTLQKDNPNFTLTNGGGLATYTITAAENTVSVDGTQTETYTGQPISVKYNANGTNSVQVSISSKDGATASLSNVQLDSGDFQIVDVSGKPITATNAGGVYHIVLTDTGIAKIQQAVGDNYKISQGTSFGTLVINKAQASAEFSGNPSYAYTGSPNRDYLNGFSIKLNEPNNPTYNLVAGDIEFNVDGTWTTTVPINVGKYEVRLSQAGWDHIKEINSDNVTWAATASSGTGTYTITPASANTELSGHNSMVYNGNSVTTADLYTDGSTIKVAINGNNVVNLPTSFTLADGDYAWNTQDGKTPVNAGNYTLTLSSVGLDKIQAAIDEAVGKGNVILSKDNTGSATFQIEQAISPDVQLDGNEKSEYNGHAISFDPTNEEIKKNFGFNNVQGLTIPDLTADDFEWVDQDGKQIAAPTDAGYYYLQLNEKGKSAFATANPNYTFVKDGKSTISGHITYHIYPASLIIGVSGTASQVYNGQNAAISQTQLDNGDIKLVWGNSNDEPIGLGSFTLAPEDLEVVDSAGNPVSHANAQENDKTGNPAYYVRLTSTALNKIKNLTGASNYDISLGGTTGNFLIYARKAQVTLSGNQTTTYGADLAFDPSAYHIELTNWNSSVPVPTDAEIIQAIGGLKSGDVYINGFTNGQMPVNVGTYQVKIADQLLQRLQAAFPDYDWDAVNGTDSPARSGSSDLHSVDGKHEPATYVITPADTTVTINGAEHIKYGENATIQYGDDNGYTITITAPIKNATTNNEHEPIYTDLKLEAGDLEFVTTPGNVGTYQVKLSAQGLKKLQDLTGSTNYNWTQAPEARANFFVDQMPVIIAVSGNEQNVTYGSNDWLSAIKKNPQGYTLTVITENGDTLNYQAKDGDLIFSQAPGNVGSYQVVLSSQGLDNIKSALGTNYTYPQDASDVTTYGTFNVNQGEVTIGLDGSDSKTYDGKATTPADLNTGKYNLTYSATVYAPDGTAQTIKLTSANLQFANGDPVNAGSYTVELSPVGQAKLKSLTGNNGDNYKWTFNTKATYTINTATDAGASLSGSNQMIFNGSAVTTAEINNGGDIIVNLVFPGSTENSIYHLQDGDYVWTNGNAPTNVGTYTIELTADGLAHLQAAIDQYAGSENVKISADSLTGSATFEIVPKSIADVTISGKDQEKTYDGQAASLDVNDLTISGSELVTDNSLSMKDITASDFDWYDAQGKKLDAVPTNAGVYEARLKSSALQTLQADNPNYSFNTASGTIKYTINQKAATDTLGGNGNKVYNGQEISVSDVFNSITWTPSGLVDGQNLDLSKLTADDYAWYTKNADGTYTKMTGLPTNAGTYYLKLKDSSITKIQAANPNYSFATGAISGEYTYKINQANATITLPDTSTQTITWTGNPATINPASFIPEITTDNPNEKAIALPSTLQLTASDYEFLQNGQVISAPSEVGTYQVRLSQTGWQKVQNAIARNANYTWTYQGAGDYHIEKATATITLGGSASTVYTGNPVVIPTTDGVVNGISVKLSNGQTYVLKPADLEFVDKQGNQIPVPTNAGNYKVRLIEASLDQIRNLESNHYNYTYNNDAVDFTVEKANANVTTSGSYDVVYNGQAPEIKVAKIANAVNTNNGVNLTALTLSADDYEWVDEDGKAIANPVNVGTYYLKLKDSSQSKIATNNNYTWNFNGLASVTISKANATIEFNGSQKTSYTGSVVALDPGNFEIKLSNGQTYQLTDKDIQVIGNPINVGTYQVKLSKAGIGAIKAADSNYNYSYDGSKGSLTIVPAKATATISGSQTTQDLELDPSHYTVVVNGQTITALTTSDFIFSKDGHPAKLTEAGTYDVELNGDAINQIQNENPNYDITFSSTATFTLENSSQTINYVDTDGKVISASSVGGKLKGTKLPFTPEFPAGWVASDPSSVPTEITLENGITTIKIKHGVTNVDHTNPVPDGEKTVTGSVIDGAHENDLNQTITRTIVVTNPDGTKSIEVQTAKIYRDATYDDVTGDVTYGEWSTAKWDAYTPENIPGYTVSESVVPEVEVKNGQQDETVNITYTANEQSGIISYQDTAGKEIGTTLLSGKTGEAIAVNPEIPAGWQLVPGQGIPKTVTATADRIPTVIVKVEHKTVVVTPATPATDIPTGKVPGDPSKNYSTMEKLTVTPTRTINIKYPSGEEQSIPQKVTFTRTAVFDEVTGEIKYTEWLPQGTAQWASYQPTTVTNYVPSQKIVPAMTVNPETPNETVDITYDKIPEPQEGQEIISYQDANGQVIHTQTVTGEEDSDVSFKPEVPTNWQPTGELPQSVKITSGTTVIVIEPVTVPVQEHRTVTRTIVEHLPSGDKQTVQTVGLTGTGTKNLVTGEVTDVKWNRGKFAAFTPATVPGYTTNMRIVPEIDVTAASGDSTVEINYIPNEQTGMIIYRDENSSDISQTALKGKTGAKVAVNLTVPAGWQLVSGQSIPATVTATPDGIPDVVVLIKHQTIIVKPGEEAPTEKVHGNPSTTYEKMESLTKEVTRTITVKLPDGQRQIITQAVTFTRTATFDAVTGKATYSAWQVDGSNEWPAYTAPEINGYTASQVSIPAEIVIPSDKNQSIEIEYTKNNQPAEPDQPVTPITPDQPTTPTNPDQPVTPTQPAQPTEPSVPTNDGDKLVPDDQLPTKPVEQEKQQASNQHFVLRQLAQTRTEGKSKANALPQTGNDQNNNSVLGFAFAVLAGIFGLTSMKKKKREK